MGKRLNQSEQSTASVTPTKESKRKNRGDKVILLSKDIIEN